MVKRTSLLIMISLLFLLKPIHVSRTRRKRVLFGEEGLEEHRDEVESYRYYVFLSLQRPAWLWRKLDVFLAPEPANLVCGGSLLTPFIIQTAAHCVATPKPATKDGWVYYKPKEVFEEPRYVYLGSNRVTAMVEWLNPRRYVVSAQTRLLKCGAGHIIHDFGIVLTKKLLDEEHPNSAISYAPVYPEERIKKFYDEAITKEYMCLHIGHGRWSVIRKTDESGEHDIYWVEKKASDPIRWGWRNIMNARDCEYVSYTKTCRSKYYFNYTRLASWVCHRSVKFNPRIKEFIHHFGNGDSGGPVTCNNVYFSVISGGSSFADVNIISTSDPIKLTLFDNAAERRDDMILFYGDLAFKKNPYTQYFPRSQCPPSTLACNVLLTMITLSYLLS